ncbi:hypothetical protein C7974DRAFT_95874 [Boeremia exigua]|uniref:uncharacterized protein n=1 Tax=Boeremia exigua TaxID=749465 RepID=UPI001E8CA599|nr:uncharacterized protein C7974DRAFT_95874 [Boeremia exigua]KAH6642130.1 hypothetical protein C7974DRAFT_95874 [Boeremia exigua]
MSSKTQPAGPATAAAKQTRSRKAANPDAAATGRAGSAGGVMLEREAVKKTSTSTPSTVQKATPSQPKATPSQPKAAASQPKPTPSTAPKPTTAQPKDAPPKRKPRKLNKEPTSTPTPSAAAKDPPFPSAAELEALKARVRGLEARVEDLYKAAPAPSAATPAATPRSPRRRGKSRKTSSATTTATLGTLRDEREREQSGAVDEDADADADAYADADADAELGRLEDELAVARRALALSQPPLRHANADADVEDIPRDRGPAVGAPDRLVTLSGSYRIPLPASLNPADVATIQSGVAAARDVARSFMEQRRASADRASTSASGGGGAKTGRASARSQEGGVEAGEGQAGRQGWGEWIGGYSMAISRAVKSIEHEAAMEAQRPGQARTGTGGAARKKRPAAKTVISGEQIQGLMS